MFLTWCNTKYLKLNNKACIIVYELDYFSFAWCFASVDLNWLARKLTCAKWCGYFVGHLDNAKQKKLPMFIINFLTIKMVKFMYYLLYVSFYYKLQWSSNSPFTLVRWWDVASSARGFFKTTTIFCMSIIRCYKIQIRNNCYSIRTISALERQYFFNINLCWYCIEHIQMHADDLIWQNPSINAIPDLSSPSRDVSNKAWRWIHQTWLQRVIMIGIYVFYPALSKVPKRNIQSIKYHLPIKLLPVTVVSTSANIWNKLYSFIQ